MEDISQSKAQELDTALSPKDDNQDPISASEDLNIERAPKSKNQKPSPAAKSTSHDPATVEGESERARIERLGRQRPEQLGSLWKEAGFVFSVVMSQALNEYFISGFIILIPTVVKALDIPPQAVTWPSSSFSLVISCCLIPFGRLADIYGGFLVYIAGIAWTAIWALIVSFSQNEIVFDVCRAVQGLGPAAYLPSGLMLLGSVYRPGSRKNLIFSLYGAMAPLGFFIGIFFAGVAGEFAGWRWFFWIGTILSFLTGVVAYFTVPNDYGEHKHTGVEMDWLGTITTVAGLILLVFAITDSAHAPHGWATPYIYVTFTLGILTLAAAFYVEGWVAEQPLLPFEVFKIRYVMPFILGLLLAYGTLGIYILYATLYTTNIMGASQFQLVAWFLPLGIGGVFLAIFGGLVLHKIHANILMAISSIATIIDSLLFALLPKNGGYWAWVFPAMLCATIAIDMLFTVASVFFSKTLPARRQGLAGALSNVLLQLGIALLLGFADIVASSTAYQGQRRSYKNVFWFELACGAASLCIFMLFVRIDSARSDYTADEKEAAKGEEVAT